jgi:hypothetical protein
MHSSPIASWEGAGAYFTFADNPVMLMLMFILAVAVTVGVIGAMIVHEKHSFHRVKNGR